MRSLVQILSRPLKREMYASHWKVGEVWEWPRADGWKWRDLKKESITNKLLTLKKRGKGPLSKK